ncbi:MAG: hypothetical protein VKK80_14870 [Prochlorothrix sp.]|nr:hypothetical protein [Prochlorothrix sp.]
MDQSCVIRSFVWGTGVLATVGLVLAVPSPSHAENLTRTSSTEAYIACGAALQAVGLTAQETATVCAQSLRPEEMAICATTIAESIAMTTGREELDLSASGVMPMTIVENCYQVRRPLALGVCVAEIQAHEAFLGQTALVTPVLETCRRSRLPDVLANCAVGLATTTELDQQTLLSTCLLGEAEHFEFSGTR